MIKGLLIDLDGTLVDTHPFLFQVFTQFLDKFEKVGSKQEFESLIGPTLPEIVAVLKKRYQLIPSEDELYQKYTEMLESGGGTLIKGVRSFLYFAKTENLRLGVVTSGPKAWAERLLTSLGIRDSFEFIVSSDDVDSGKPNPEGYLEGAKRLGLDKAELLVVEDSAHGMEAAKRAGIKAIWVDWGKITETLLELFYPCMVSGPVLISEDNSLISKEDRLQIEKIWEEELRKRPQLFNGQIFYFDRIDNGQIIGFFRDYKTFLAGKINPALIKQGIPMAVTALACHEGKVLFGKRVSHLTQYPGYWELTPSGGLSQLDPLKEIQIELEEETGLSRDKIVSIDCLGLFYDSHLNSYEIVYKIELNDSEVKVSDEVTEFCWLKPSELTQANLTPLVPFTLRCLNLI